MTRFIVALTIVVALFAVACGGDSEGGGAPFGQTPDQGERNGTSDNGDTGGDEGDRGGARAFASLFPGYCINLSFDAAGQPNIAAGPEVVECDESHTTEVVRVVRMELGPGEPWPGPFVIRAAANDACNPAYDNYLGVEQGQRPAALMPTSLFPGERSWNEGAREIICLLTLRGAELRGSIAGAGLDVLPAGFPEGAPRPSGWGMFMVGPADLTLTSSAARQAIESALPSLDGLFMAGFAVPPTIDVPQEAAELFEDAVGDSDWTLTDQLEAGAGNLYVLERGGNTLVVQVEARAYRYYYQPE